MKKIVFHMDLDNTIIYTEKHMLNADKQCVERYEGREFSFVTPKTYELLQKITKQVIMVPTTTRTIQQYNRIDLKVGTFSYALVCNGGVLLVDGKEDEGWYAQSLRRICRSKKELIQAMEFLEKDKRRTFELRFIRELFVFTKCEEPMAVTEELKERLDMEVVDVFQNGVKIYVVPKSLSKGDAVCRFREYVGADYVIAAGDSDFDISMLESSDLGIAPYDLSNRYRFSDNVKCLTDQVLYADALLEYVYRIINTIC